MNRGVRRLLASVTKYVIIPLLLLLLGYLVLGPLVSNMMGAERAGSNKSAQA